MTTTEIVEFQECVKRPSIAKFYEAKEDITIIQNPHATYKLYAGDILIVEDETFCHVMSREYFIEHYDVIINKYTTIID